MPTIKLTSKRQATFPRALCEQMNVEPGDSLELVERVLDGERVWLVKPAAHETPWFGCLHEYAQGKSHRMEDIRKSVAEARRHGRI